MEIELSHWMDLPPPLSDDDADDNEDDPLLDDIGDEFLASGISIYWYLKYPKLQIHHHQTTIPAMTTSVEQETVVIRRRGQPKGSKNKNPQFN
ncbi:hypothetical protein BpHYR1_011561 [Brachionus plicatilis]|uniref:Uncharacterized protein n=1 Tax=Brachionus plicatilis TaxID=10195 RepID=A0A3M7SRP1_BRAPC|nr:hypothetical protein BpHYR1_011561 [Brachionus plicatilis]